MVAATPSVASSGICHRNKSQLNCTTLSRAKPKIVSYTTTTTTTTLQAVKFNEYLQSFELKQHVSSPTHNKGGILDVFITRSDQPSPEIFVHAPSISDHSLIEGHLPVQPMTVFDLFSVCTWNKFDKKAFQRDLLSSELFSKDADLSELTVEVLFSRYDSILWCLLDKYLPVCKVSLRALSHAASILFSPRQQSRF